MTACTSLKVGDALCYKAGLFTGWTECTLSDWPPLVWFVCAVFTVALWCKMGFLPSLAFKSCNTLPLALVCEIVTLFFCCHNILRQTKIFPFVLLLLLKAFVWICSFVRLTGCSSSFTWKLWKSVLMSLFPPCSLLSPYWHSSIFKPPYEMQPLLLMHGLVDLYRTQRST